MGEIKSTLDLVMEKTSHLKLSTEEKDQQQRTALEKRMGGLVQKVAGGLVRNEMFERQLSDIRQQCPGNVENLLFRQILSGIDPAENNEKLLRLLERQSYPEADAVRRLLEDYAAAVAALTRERTQRIRAELEKEHAVSGTAVKPNCSQDERWREAVAGMGQKVRDELQKMIERCDW